MLKIFAKKNPKAWRNIFLQEVTIEVIQLYFCVIVDEIIIYADIWLCETVTTAEK